MQGLFRIVYKLVPKCCYNIDIDIHDIFHIIYTVPDEMITYDIPKTFNEHVENAFGNGYEKNPSRIYVGNYI
eukprot:2830006-Amphidinium_carterae.1